MIRQKDGGRKERAECGGVRAFIRRSIGTRGGVWISKANKY